MVVTLRKFFSLLVSVIYFKTYWGPYHWMGTFLGICLIAFQSFFWRIFKAFIFTLSFWWYSSICWKYNVKSYILFRVEQQWKEAKVTDSRPFLFKFLYLFRISVPALLSRSTKLTLCQKLWLFRCSVISPFRQIWFR